MNEDTNRLRKAIQKRLPENIKLDPNVEHLILLDYILFMERLAEESAKVTRDNKDAKFRGIRGNDIAEVMQTVLQEFRG